MSNTLNEAKKLFDLAVDDYRVALDLSRAGDVVKANQALVLGYKHLSRANAILAARVRELEFDPIPDHIQMQVARMQHTIDSIQHTPELPTPGDLVQFGDQRGTVTRLTSDQAMRVQFYRAGVSLIADMPTDSAIVIEKHTLPRDEPLPEHERYRIVWFYRNLGTWDARDLPFSLTAHDVMGHNRVNGSGIVTCAESTSGFLYAIPSRF